MHSNNILTFDVGGMGIKIIKFVNYKLVFEDYLEHTEFKKGTTSKLINVLEKINNYIVKNGEEVEIGISLPGVIDQKNKEILTKSFLQEIKGINIQEYFLKNKLVRRCLIENDAKAAAFGEFKTIQSKGMENCFVMTIGSAVGGALIINNKIYNGRQGLAGEVSKIYSDIQKSDELVVAHTSSTMYLQRIYSEKIQVDLDKVSGKSIMQKFAEKDKTAIESVEYVVNSIARLIFNINTIVDVECFLIGGGISGNNLFIEELKKTVIKYFKNQEILEFMPEIKVCTLKNQAACFGMMHKIKEETNG